MHTKRCELLPAVRFLRKAAVINAPMQHIAHIVKRDMSGTQSIIASERGD